MAPRANTAIIGLFRTNDILHDVKSLLHDPFTYHTQVIMYEAQVFGWFELYQHLILFTFGCLHKLLLVNVFMGMRHNYTKQKLCNWGHFIKDCGIVLVPTHAVGYMSCLTATSHSNLKVSFMIVEPTIHVLIGYCVGAYYA